MRHKKLSRDRHHLPFIKAGSVSLRLKTKKKIGSD